MIKYFLLILLSCTGVGLQAQYTIVTDDFTGAPQFIDNSLLIHWGSNTSPVSAFEVKDKADNAGLTYPALQLTDSAQVYANYHSFPTSTKALTCIDYHFTPINRNTDTLWVEFDIIWERITNSGESGRINAILLHEYPAGGAKFGEVDSLNLPHPFGRPAYFFRIRSRNPALGNGYGFMGYGGNNDPLGKLYIHDSAGVPKHWLPGAVPVSGNFPPAFPAGGAVDLTAVASATEWRHVTWAILPNQLTVSRRKSGTAGPETVVSTLPTPTTSDAPFYNYFDKIEAFRLYLYGAGENIFVANMKITSTAAGASLVTATAAPVPGLDSIFPNPFNDYIEINHTYGTGGRVRLADISGQLLMSEPLLTGSHRLDVPDVKPGVYLLFLEGADGLSSVKKVIKY